MIVEIEGRTLLIGALLAVLFAVGVTLALRRWHAAWQRRRRWLRATRAESRAATWLQQLGYEVLGAQVEGSYAVAVDGTESSICLRADYVVTRNGLTYVAEVKSGNLAPKLSTAATRRQLLEYLLGFDVDGVLLVDGETRRIHEIVFSIAKRQPETQRPVSAIPYVLCAVVGIVAVVLDRYWR